tara:strand:+ start:281 stop:1165 length:885 start_codon:yes stop_codon:yes gene_type:complete
MGPDALAGLPMTRSIQSDCQDAVLVSGSGTLAVTTAMRHARAGADVVLTCPSSGLLPDFDPVLSAVVLECLTAAQIDVLPDVSFAGAEAEADAARVVLEDGTVLGVFESVVPAQPTGGMVDGLDLSNTTVQLDQSGWISVDEQGMTGETRIRAAGGVTGQALEAGAAHRHGEVVAEVVCGLDSTWDPAVTPSWLETPIPVSWCGLNETRGADLGHDPISTSHGSDHDMIRMVHDRQTGLLLGSGAAGPSARIVAEAAVVAIEMGSTIEDLAALTPVDATLPGLGTIARTAWSIS